MELARWLTGESATADPVQRLIKSKEWARQWLASRTCANGYSYDEFISLSDAFRGTVGQLPGMSPDMVPQATEEEYSAALALGGCAPGMGWGTDEQRLADAYLKDRDRLREEMVRRGYVGAGWALGAIALAALGALAYSLWGGKKKGRRKKR
jgi:hypothetical protein